MILCATYMRRFALLFLVLSGIGGVSLSKPKLTFDEFFNCTQLTFFALAPDDGQSILIQTTHHLWKESVNEEHLYLQSLQGENKVLIATRVSAAFKTHWHGEWIAYIADNKVGKSKDEQQYEIQLF
jgi:hypothetical protein